MASVLYDLRMICWLFVWWKSEAVRSGVGVVKNLERGLFWLNGRVICSPQAGTKHGGCSEKTRCHKEKGTRRLNRMPRFVCHAKFSQTRFPQDCICLRRSGWVKIAISGRCPNRMPPGITTPNVKKHVVSLGGHLFSF